MKLSIHLTLALIAATAGVVRAQPDAFGNQQIVNPSRSLEAYVPSDQPAVQIASIELRSAATINGTGDVTLRQVCRWPEADNDKFAAVADLVVLKLGASSGFGTVDVEQIQTALSDAGVATGAINFSGAVRCTVSRADVTVDEGDALRQWVASGEQSPQAQPVAEKAFPSNQHPPVPPQVPSGTPVAAAPVIEPQPVIAAPAPAAAAPAMSTGDLRAALISDIAARTRIPVTRLQVDFAPQDRALLSLAPPAVQFTIEPQRYGDLGETSWFVTFNANAANARKVRINAKARAWVDQVVLKRSINTREGINAEDVETRPTLVDRLAPDNIASAQAVVGKQASRDLRAGTILSDRMIAPLEMVRSGQAVTVTMRRGAIQVRSVATAMQSGALGQNVRVRNPQTNEIYEVQLTGPQAGIVPGSDPVLADANN